jgi:hypothetical protein
MYLRSSVGQQVSLIDSEISFRRQRGFQRFYCFCFLLRRLSA